MAAPGVGASAVNAQLVDVAQDSPAATADAVPNTGELTGSFVGTLGGGAGLVAVGGGLLVASGGGALWLKRRHAGRRERGGTAGS